MHNDGIIKFLKFVVFYLNNIILDEPNALLQYNTLIFYSVDRLVQTHRIHILTNTLTRYRNAYNKYAMSIVNVVLVYNI